MSHRKSLPGARWIPPELKMTDARLAYQYKHGILDELDTAIYGTIKKATSKRPRAEIVEVWAEAFQMTKVDIANHPHWGTLTKEEKFEFACERAKANANKAMRHPTTVNENGQRLSMWQVKGDEAHIAHKIGGAHYEIGEGRNRDSQGRLKDKKHKRLEEAVEEDFDSEEDFDFEEDFEFDESDDADVNADVNADDADVKEVSTTDDTEHERIERRDEADYQTGSARQDTLEAAPEGASALLSGEKRVEPPAPGLSSDSTADDDDKPNLMHDFLENQGGHVTYRADWVKCHAEQNKVLDRLHIEQQIARHPDGVEAKAAKAKEEAETDYEALVRILGPKDADWLWGYKWGIAGSNQRTRSASSDKDRARAYRLCRKIKKAYMKTPAGIVKERQAGEQILVHLGPLCSAVRQERRKSRSEQMWEQSHDDFVTTRALSERDTPSPSGQADALQRSARSQLDVPPPVLAAGTNTRIT